MFGPLLLQYAVVHNEILQSVLATPVTTSVLLVAR